MVRDYIVLATLAMLAFGVGCSAPRVVVVEEEESSPGRPVGDAIVSFPLPGVSQAVVDTVVSAFDSTFVSAGAEREAEAHFMEARQVQEHLARLLLRQHGSGPLGRVDSLSVDSSMVDSASAAVVAAQQVAVAAAQAQARQDSTQVQALLDQAQRLYELALQHHPYHGEARYQLARLYTLQAQRHRERHRWEAALQVLRGLLTLNADQHVLWAELAVVLDTLRQYEASGLAWMQAATVVLEDAQLALAHPAPAPDSLMLFTYYQRAYNVWVRDRHGSGVRQALVQARTYATDAQQRTYAEKELAWVRWDGDHFAHRLAFDSLRTAATQDPAGARDGLAALLGQLTQPTARLETTYNVAILTWQLQQYDRALDTLQGLWARATPTAPMPYAAFREEVRELYANLLFQRGLQHQQEGASAKAFTYLLMVTELNSHRTGAAYLEALRLARNNPRQAQQLEPRLEAVFDQLTPEQQRTYLALMGNLYRRVGANEKVQHFLARYRALVQ